MAGFAGFVTFALCSLFYCWQAVCRISWTSCSRPSLCNDRCRFWSGQCSALPVETPQAQFWDKVMVITTCFMVHTVQTVQLELRQIFVVRFNSCRTLGGRSVSDVRWGACRLSREFRALREVCQVLLDPERVAQFFDPCQKVFALRCVSASGSRGCVAAGVFVISLVPKHGCLFGLALDLFLETPLLCVWCVGLVLAAVP